MNRIVLAGLFGATALLSACKSKAQETKVYDPGLSGPATQLGDHLIPAFTEVSTYVRLLQTQLASAFAKSKITALTALPCGDPRINIAMRPERTKLESCQAWLDKDNNPHVVAKFSNRWLIVGDPQGIRRVNEQDFAAASAVQ